MKINAVSLFTLIALTGLSGLSLAEDRADVLERIAPIGKVNVEGQAKTEPAAAPAPAAEPAAAEAPAAEASVTEAPAAPAPAAGGDAVALATKSGCLACHQVEMKVVGPAYKDVAAKYKGDAGALDMLVAKVKAGGSGVWGPVPMPPNPQVPEADIRTIVEWVLSH